MLHWLSNFQTIRNQYHQGLWNSELIEDARHLAIKYPNKYTQTLYIEIQHSISGFDRSTLEFVNSFQDRNTSKTCLSLRLRLLALNLEYGLIDTISADDISSRFYNQRLLKSYPAILTLLDEKKPQFSNLKASMANARSLLATKSTFDTFLEHKRPATVAVVGNSPAGIGLGAGQKIDACDLVIRFNNAVDRDKYSADYGVKTDIWVISPAYKPTANQLVSRHITVSGINPFNKRGLFWINLSAIENIKLFIFPSDIWYELVKKLSAPPSAGLLCLYTLHHSGIASDDIQIHGFSTMGSSTMGFNTTESAEKNNHYADNTMKSSRHNWQAETSLVQSLVETR